MCGCIIPFLPGLFTSDPTVAGVIASIMPIIAITQPISSVAFLLDGVLYGVSGFAFAAGWMAISGGGAVVTMMLVNKMVSSSSIGSGTWILGGSSQLIGIWGGLVMLMVLRVVTILVPFLKRWKPFDQLSIVS
jgi:Na+-driven multidrug efflux pump